MHRANVHAIDALWWFRDYEGCEHRAKSNGHITKHMAMKHNIGFQWKQRKHCDYKAKENGILTKHVKSMHTSK